MPRKGYDCFDLASKPKAPYCQVCGCRNLRQPGRTVCQVHHMRAWRLKHPLKAAYATLRDHAKRRKVGFSLTLEQFKRLVSESGYLEKRGTTREALQLDRINALDGYHFHNLRVITCSENAIKGATEDKRMKLNGNDSPADDIYFPPEFPDGVFTISHEFAVSENCPF